MNGVSQARSVVFALFTHLLLIISIDAAEPVNPLPEYRAELKKQQEILTQKLDAVAATVQEEEKAQRLTLQAAQRQRGVVQEYRERIQPPYAELFSMGGPVRPREADVNEKDAGAAAPALRKAWAAFSEALREWVSRHTTALRNLHTATVQYALALWREAKTEADLAPALDALQAAENEPYPGGQTIQPRRSTTADAITLLTQSQQFLAALAAGDTQVLGAALNGMNVYPRGGPPVVTPAEVEAWRQRFSKSNREQLNAFQKTLDELIAKRVAAAEVLALADKIDLLRAVERTLASSRGFGGPFPGATNEGRVEVYFARSWGRLLEAIEQKNWNAAGAISGEMQPPAQSLSPPALAVVNETRAEVSRQIAALHQAARSTGEKRARARLAKVSDAASALALADELKTERESSGTAAETSDFPAFEADLRQLAALWSADPAQPQASFEPWKEKANAPGWNEEVRALRSKAFRDYVARRTESPELLTAPLGTLPPEQAVRQLERDLLARGEWARLHRLLSDASVLFGDRRSGANSEEMLAVRAFITGQNFEKAEQLPEAVQAYRSVLGYIGELVPVEAAAERLKALKQAHPDAFKEEAAGGVNRVPFFTPPIRSF